jgi:hypothetical protein
MELYQYLLKQKEAADFHYGIGQCYGKKLRLRYITFHLQKAFAPNENRTEGVITMRIF